jgi:hypothetical protein
LWLRHPAGPKTLKWSKNSYWACFCLSNALALALIKGVLFNIAVLGLTALSETFDLTGLLALSETFDLTGLPTGPKTLKWSKI